MIDPDPDVALARDLAEHVIARFGPAAPPPLRVRRVECTEPHLVLVELSARVAGVACWVCPKDPAHHTEPILPAG